MIQIRHVKGYAADTYHNDDTLQHAGHGVKGLIGDSLEDAFTDLDHECVEPGEQGP